MTAPNDILEPLMHVAVPLFPLGVAITVVDVARIHRSITYRY